MHGEQQHGGLRVVLGLLGLVLGRAGVLVDGPRVSEGIDGAAIEAGGRAGAAGGPRRRGAGRTPRTASRRAWSQ